MNRRQLFASGLASALVSLLTQMGYAQEAEPDEPNVITIPRRRGRDKRRTLEIEELRFDQHPQTMFDVAIQPEPRPEGVEPVVVGMMDFFAMSGWGDAVQHHHHAHDISPETASYSYDLEDAIEALGLEPGDKARVVLIPTDGTERAKGAPEPEAVDPPPGALILVKRVRAVE